MKYKLYGDILEIDMMNEYHNIHDFLDAFYIPIKKQNSLINSKRITMKDNIVRIQLESEEVDWVLSEEEANVVYEDDFILVVHKDPGYIIHDKEDNNCLNARVARYYINNNISSYVRPIHRLDKDTMGLVIYSKISFFQPYFDKQIENKNIKRFYKAIVKGKCQKNQKFTIKDKIGRNRHISGTYIVSKSGKDAITNVRCIDTKRDYALLECELETGRTHQIRVHLSNHKLPIINDAIYGVKDKLLPYMGLWAYKVIINNPITHESIVIEDRDRKEFKI